MGEYARQYTLDRHGVDIGDDERPEPQRKRPRFGCSCGRVFCNERALLDHKRDKHGAKEDRNVG